MVIVLTTVVSDSRGSVHPCPGTDGSPEIGAVPSSVGIQVCGIGRLNGGEEVKNRIRGGRSLIDPTIEVKTGVSVPMMTKNPISSIRRNDTLFVSCVVGSITGNGEGGVAAFVK